MRHITISYWHERRLHLPDHVAPFNGADPAYQSLLLKTSSGQGRRRGRPQSSWLQQVDTDYKEFDTGPGLPRRDLWSITTSWMRLRTALAHASTIHDMTPA